MRDRNFYRGDYKEYLQHRHKNRVFAGVVIAIVGLVLLLTKMRVLPCIDLEFSWPAILIVFGLLIGIKNSFRNNAWWILIIIGIANFTPQFMIMGRPSREYAWPAIIIIIGLAIALRPRRHTFFSGYPRSTTMNSAINTDNSLNIDVTFGGKKEVVTSKEFKGGTISVTFAGCELNLNQADFSEPSIALDLRVSFGGVEMIVPSHWEIQNEINPSFGSVEDQRTIQTGTSNETKKILVLRGSCAFGSIEIKSY